MIIEVTHEGNGVFKVWPPPRTPQEIKSIIGRILMQDPSNARKVETQFPIFDQGYSVDDEDDI